MQEILTNPFGFIGNLLRDLLLAIGLPTWLIDLLFAIVGAVVLIGVVLLIAGVILTWVVRKVSARIQDRLGPNRVGPFGLVQGVADAIKLITKEDITPAGADKIVYNIAPLLAVMAVAAIWTVMPLAPRLVGADINVAVLFFVAIGGVGTLAIIMGGWASNNKYAMLGAFRTVAMLISFEIPMALALLIPVMLAGSMGMTTIVEQQGQTWFLILAPIAALIFFVSSIAEVGWTPFDLAEAESEIVAGFNIEYSGMKFGVFMISEFLHAFTIAALVTVLFLGGWQGPGAETYPMLGLMYFAIKTILVYFVILLIRFSMPRIRIDQMLGLNWKFLVPLVLVAVVVTAIADKLAIHMGWSQTTTLLAANAVLALVTLWIVRAYARALRQRVEGMDDPEAAQIMGAAAP